MIEHFHADHELRPWLRDVLVRDWAIHDEPSLVAALRSLDGGQAPTLAELRALATPLALVGWPDDPGHPLAVAESWSDAATEASLETIALSDLDDDVTRFGKAAVVALGRLGIRP
jgi:predicted alpha/beta hydrolase